MTTSAPASRSALPTLFVSHGAPTFALDPGEAGHELRALAEALPAPKAVLVVSPHWMSAGVVVGASARPATMHDFGGFPDPLYALDYPAPGAPALAERTRLLLGQAGIEARLDPRRGLDHGAWVPLRHMFPAANVPVVQVAMPHGATPQAMHALGSALAPLRNEEVLLIGSGSITHNLYEFRGNRPADAYVASFTEWIAATLATRDTAALLDYRRRAPHAERAHPTDEHLLPLMFALGAAGPTASARRLAAHDVRYGMLAMDAYVFEPAS